MIMEIKKFDEMTDIEKEEFLNSSVDIIGLSKERTQNLKNNGVYTIQDLLALKTPEVRKKLNGNKNALRDLNRLISPYGLEFKIKQFNNHTGVKFSEPKIKSFDVLSADEKQRNEFYSMDLRLFLSHPSDCLVSLSMS